MAAWTASPATSRHSSEKVGCIACFTLRGAEVLAVVVDGKVGDHQLAAALELGGALEEDGLPVGRRLRREARLRLRVRRRRRVQRVGQPARRRRRQPVHRRRAKAEVDRRRREALLVERRAAREDVDVVGAPVHVRRRAVGDLAVHQLEHRLPVVHRLVLVVHHDRRARLGGADGADDRRQQRERGAAVGRPKVGDVERRGVRIARARAGGQRHVDRLLHLRRAAITSKQPLVAAVLRRCRGRSRSTGRARPRSRPSTRGRGKGEARVTSRPRSGGHVVAPSCTG